MKYYWITVMQDTGHSRKSLQVVSFHSFNAFSSQKTPPMCFAPPYAPCDVTAMNTMPPIGRAHPQVYCVQK